MTAEYQWKVDEPLVQPLCSVHRTSATHPHEGSLDQFIMNTTGAIRLNEAAVASNITSPMSLGRCGRPLRWI